MERFSIPTPIIDQREENTLEILNKQFEKLTKPKLMTKVGKSISNVVPSKVKSIFSDLGGSISEQELYMRIMEYIGSSFKLLQETAAKYTIPRKKIIQQINAITPENTIRHTSEFCLARGYDISKQVGKYKDGDVLLAVLEGASTGALGFAGLVPNIVLCTFLCFRAVQAIATYYGYDVRENPDELIIATEVFTNALSPTTANTDELSTTITRIMAFGEIAALKQAIVKPYADMAAQGGIALLVVQMRALANNAAKKGLEQAGKKGLEESMFKGVFKQIGKGLSKKSVGKMIPGLSAVIGAAIDTTQMKTVLTYADIFYHKRFLLEKEQRIDILLGPPNNIVDI